MSINNEMSSAEVAGAAPVAVPSVDAVANAAPPACADLKGRSGREIMYRHSIAVRITHWVNVACLALLLMSGLRLFNYHPALYFGNYGYRGCRPCSRSMRLRTSETGDPVGVTTIAGRNFITTGVLGVALTTVRRSGGRRFSELDHAARRPGPWPCARLAFCPRLGIRLERRRLSAVRIAVSGHFRRDLVPAGSELRAVARSLSEILDHLRLRRPRGEAARHYNVLQKLAYLIVIFVLLPLMVLTGLTMSPAVTAAVPVPVRPVRRPAVGAHHPFHHRQPVGPVRARPRDRGRDPAGPLNELRSMITGRFAIRRRAGNERG